MMEGWGHTGRQDRELRETALQNDVIVHGV